VTAAPHEDGHARSAAGWAELAGRARPYLAAGAWQSAHDLLWPAFVRGWDAGISCPGEAVEALCLLLNACARLNHAAHLRAGSKRLSRAVAEHPPASADTAALCDLVLGQQEIREGRYEDARSRLDARRPESAGIGRDTRARLELLRSRLAAVQGREDEAEGHALAAARLAEQGEHGILKGDAFSMLAILARRRGALADANTLYARSAQCAWSAGDWNGHAVVLLNRAWTVALIGLVSHARALFEEARRQALALGRDTTVLLARLGLGWLALRAGRPAEARAGLLTVWRLAREMKLAREEGLALEILAEAALLTGRLAQARVALRCGMRVVGRIAPEGDLALGLRICAAELALVEGRADESGALAKEAIARARRLRAPWEEAQAWRVLGTACFHGGDRERAREAFGEAGARLAAMGEWIERRVVAAWLDALADRAHPLACAPLEGEPEQEAGARLRLDHPRLGPPRAGASAGAARAGAGPAVMQEAGGEGPGRRGARPARLPAFQDAAERGRGPAPSAPSIRDMARSALHPVWNVVGLVTRTLRLVETYAPGRIPALILGETGTGKDLVARGVHALSGRPGPLVPLNCAAARKDLLAAELFGARRGAYTGANADRRGLLEEAEGGTIFLDEVADLEAEAQGFLLRFLDSGEVRRIGETRSRQVDARVIAATCADLRARVADGLFRPDLFGRLAGLVVRVPPLRERLEDLEPLVATLWLRETGEAESWRPVFTADVLRVLRAWRWPGNVRELKHAVERASLFTREHGPEAAAESLVRWVEGLGAAAAEDEPASRGAADTWVWGRWDPERLARALAQAEGRIPEAARILGLSRSHAYRLYRRLGEEPSAGKEPPSPPRERTA